MTFLNRSALALSLLVLFVTVAAGCGGAATNATQAAASTSSTTSAPSSSTPSSTSTPAPAPATGSGITISSPANAAAVGSPFNLAASAPTCSSQSVISMGYSLDNSADTTAVNGTSVSEQVSAATGTHVLHVKSWGAQGASCDADVTVAVTDASSPENSLVPANATSVSNLQTSNAWHASHDPDAGASSSGSMSMVGSPSLSGHARQFATKFSGSGGEIYNLTWGNDAGASNFFYDGWVYLSSSASNIANLEMDMNQVMSNGQTVIYGFQCDGYTGTWDYTANRGSATKPSDEWVHSGAACDVRNWAKNKWHHVQISYSRDDSGKVTYHSVWLDSVEAQINATVPSAFALGWSPALVSNFQVDGQGSGSNTVYLDNLTISRW